MSRELRLDPDPADTLDSLWNRNTRLANAVEDALDWIEAQPPDARAKRRRFSNGMWGITVSAGGEDWVLVWEEIQLDRPVIRYLGERTSL